MSTIPLLLVLSAAVGLGAYNLWGWWKGVHRVGVIAAHLLLGVGGVEALVVTLHSSGLPDDDPVRHTGRIAFYLLAAAIFTGFGSPLLRRTGLANLAIAAHVGAALAGFLLVLTLGARL
jgi:hypothetical protein